MKSNPIGRDICNLKTNQCNYVTLIRLILFYRLDTYNETDFVLENLFLSGIAEQLSKINRHSKTTKHCKLQLSLNLLSIHKQDNRIRQKAEAYENIFVLITYRHQQK